MALHNELGKAGETAACQYLLAYTNLTLPTIYSV